jgi:hypothetical protein
MPNLSMYSFCKRNGPSCSAFLAGLHFHICGIQEALFWRSFAFVRAFYRHHRSNASSCNAYLRHLGRKIFRWGKIGRQDGGPSDACVNLSI